MDTTNPMARLFSVWMLALSGHLSELVRVLDGYSPSERDTVPAGTARFLGRSVLTRRRDASPSITPGIEAAAMTNDVFARFLAEGYAMAGDAESAIRWLSVAVARGYINYPFLARYDPCLEPIRANPAFQQLLEDVHARWQRFET